MGKDKFCWWKRYRYDRCFEREIIETLFQELLSREWAFGHLGGW
jgi:hypothetical protein